MKRLICLLLLATFALSLAGCHGAQKRDAFAVPSRFHTDRNYTITFWAKNDTNKTQAEIYKQAIADF